METNINVMVIESHMCQKSWLNDFVLLPVKRQDRTY